MITQNEFVTENGNDVTSMTKIQYIKNISDRDGITHRQLWEDCVYGESKNQLKSKKNEWSMVFSIYKAVYVHQTPVGVDKSWNNLENNNMILICTTVCFRLKQLYIKWKFR